MKRDKSPYTFFYLFTWVYASHIMSYMSIGNLSETQEAISRPVVTSQPKLTELPSPQPRAKMICTMLLLGERKESKEKV